MNRKDFFQKEVSEIKHNDILESLDADPIDVLNEKYLWVSKINENESERNRGLRDKAEILLGIHIGLASLLLSGSFFELFTKFTKNGLGLLFTGVVIIFIFGSILCGSLYSLKVGGIPRFVNVIDPTLSLESYNTNEKWLKDAIAETLMVYKKNLDVIKLNAFRTRLSFDFLMLAVVATLLTLIIVDVSPILADSVLCDFIKGVFLGVILLIIAWLVLTKKPRSYEK